MHDYMVLFIYGLKSLLYELWIKVWDNTYTRLYGNGKKERQIQKWRLLSCLYICLNNGVFTLLYKLFRSASYAYLPKNLKFARQYKPPEKVFHLCQPGFANKPKTLFFLIYDIFATKSWENTSKLQKIDISTSPWSHQQPNAGQNIQEQCSATSKGP